MKYKTGEMVEADHLGGYVVGGDPATYYPDLWKWLIKEFKLQAVIDVGCGDGIAVNFFRTHDVYAWGIDGVKQDSQWIIEWDYTKGPWDDPDFYYGDPIEIMTSDQLQDCFNLCWCCEFVEHVEEKYVSNFLDTFSKAKIVLMTHAEPGQNGYHHVNCQPAKYWIEKLDSIGYTLDIELTMTTRSLAAKNLNPYNHYVRSGLAFRRNP